MNHETIPWLQSGKKKREFLIIISLEHVISENAFVVLAARLRIFQSKICSTITNARHFVLDACALHNFLRGKIIISYLPLGSVDVENFQDFNISQDDWRTTKNNFINLRKISFNSSRMANYIGNRFCNYFNSARSDPWQERICKLHCFFLFFLKYVTL